MSIHVVIYKAEDESQGSVGCPACKEGLLAVPSLALPTPAVTAYSPHPCPHLMSLPEGGGGAGRTDRVWTLTLSAAGHVQGRLQPRSSGPSRLPLLQLSRRPPQAYFSHPVMGGRAFHPVTWASPQSGRGLLGFDFSSCDNLIVSMDRSVLRTCQCIWRFLCRRVILIQAFARVWVCGTCLMRPVCEHASRCESRSTVDVTAYKRIPFHVYWM